MMHGAHHPPDPDRRLRAVVLLSGGLDSATCLAIARAEGYECHALSVEYGQRHAVELAAAKRVAAALGAATHRTMSVNLAAFGGSALTDHTLAIPEADSEGIPITYVPARNTVFLALALALSETLEAQDVFIGVNAVDYSGYPDCRPEFIAAFEYLASLATRAGVEGRPLRLYTPLQHLSKAGIIRLGRELGLDYSLTHSCYDPAPDGRPCGHCDSCLLRARGFAEAGFPDPAL
jgi:7-cyano-7-deazaguanine synthase